MRPGARFPGLQRHFSLANFTENVSGRAPSPDEELMEGVFKNQFEFFDIERIGSWRWLGAPKTISSHSAEEEVYLSNSEQIGGSNFVIVKQCQTRSKFEHTLVIRLRKPPRCKSPQAIANDKQRLVTSTAQTLEFFVANTTTCQLVHVSKTWGQFTYRKGSGP